MRSGCKAKSVSLRPIYFTMWNCWETEIQFVNVIKNKWHISSSRMTVLKVNFTSSILQYGLNVDNWDMNTQKYTTYVEEGGGMKVTSTSAFASQ